jgi:hypothetical protein
LSTNSSADGEVLEEEEEEEEEGIVFVLEEVGETDVKESRKEGEIMLSGDGIVAQGVSPMIPKFERVSIPVKKDGTESARSTSQEPMSPEDRMISSTSSIAENSSV